MSKYTTTLNRFIKSEFQHMGISEIQNQVNGINVIGVDRDNAFLHKMINYDEDTQNVVNKFIFHGYSLENPQADLNFKKSFTTFFLNRELKYQTIDIFSSSLVSLMIQNEKYLNIIFSDDVEEYLLNKNESENDTENESTSSSEYRQLTSTLPQNEINLDVDNDVLSYGDNNNISKTKDTNNGNNISSQNSTIKSIDNLNKLYDLRTKAIKDFDKKLFLQIW